MTHHRGRLLLALAVFALAAAPGRAQDAADTDDPVFAAMHAELERAKTLRMDDVEDVPYHLRCYFTDTSGFSVSANLGALVSRGGGRDGSLSTDVRVGTPELDNTNFSSWSFSFSTGSGSTPAEPEPDAIRQALWLEFDKEFKSAVEAIAKKRAYLQTNTVENRPPDFGDAPVTDLLLPREELEVDRDRWTDVVRRVSGVFRAYPHAHTGTASLQASVAHQYFESSDPARHRFPFATCSFTIRASTQAPDGMNLSHSAHFDGRTVDDLPPVEELEEAARRVAEHLGALRGAPQAEDYWGPVLFTGEAAPRFFLETIGGALSNPRPNLGADRGGRLLDRMGRRIASRAMTAWDDPGVKEWNGRPLWGHYPIDDDGVLPQRVSLVESGVLKGYYMSRVPTEKVAATNGHSRGGRGSTGNLFIEAKAPVPVAELEKQMIAMLKEESLPYGLVVERLGTGSSYGGGGGQVNISAPTILYRLHTDGRRELVRGGFFKSASYRVLKDIVAFGDDPTLLNTSQYGQSVSAVAPSILVEELEYQRPRKEFGKPPYTERPPMDE